MNQKSQYALNLVQTECDEFTLFDSKGMQISNKPGTVEIIQKVAEPAYVKLTFSANVWGSVEEMRKGLAEMIERDNKIFRKDIVNK